ncbi:hypothetical protein RRG08_055624 [Elysia crispata]|uniref:Uncharacterized protein n=1 Tax=Elysia crispata TaxID=231223 RepID=A0AAE1DBD9_9GAST|nr:hypothetical protein RRG08_055624 [Elysia crispata]
MVACLVFIAPDTSVRRPNCLKQAKRGEEFRKSASPPLNKRTRTSPTRPGLRLSWLSVCLTELVTRPLETGRNSSLESQWVLMKILIRSIALKSCP